MALRYDVSAKGKKTTHYKKRIRRLHVQFGQSLSAQERLRRRRHQKFRDSLRRLSYARISDSCWILQVFQVYSDMQEAAAEHLSSRVPLPHRWLCRRCRDFLLYEGRA